MEQLPPRAQQPKWMKDALERIYWEGFAAGEENADRTLRDEIRTELEIELSGFDSDCALCVARREIKNLEHTIVVVKQERDHFMQTARGWSIRNGAREYRETKI